MGISGNAATATLATSAGTATVATNATVTTSNTNSAFKIPFINHTGTTTGNYGLLQDSQSTFTYNPNTNTLTATTFVGSLSGNATSANTATSATVATNATVTTSNTNSAFKIPFINHTGTTTGNYGLLQDSESTFTYNPNTNTLTASTFVGSLSGNATSANTATSATTATTATSAGTATVATNATVTTSNTNSAFKIPFINHTGTTTGNYGLLQDSQSTFTYNPNTNTLTATTFVGSLSGNATSANTATSATTATSADTATLATNINRTGTTSGANISYRVLLGNDNNNTGSSPAFVVTNASRLYYNPSTDSLTVGTLSGTATNCSRQILNGNGMNFTGGELNTNRTITLGTPSSITSSSENSVTTSSHTHLLADDAVTQRKINAGAVSRGKIADGAVNDLKLAVDAVTTTKINDGAVTNLKIADNAVTQNKINAGAVSRGKIVDGAINAAKLADNAVTYAKIQKVATANRLLGSTTANADVSEVQVETGMIANGAVTADKLSTSSDVNTRMFAVRAWGRVRRNPSGGDGRISGSSGWTAAALSEPGRTRVTFNPALPTGDYAVTVGIHDSSGSSSGDHLVNIVNITASRFDIVSFDTGLANNLVDGVGGSGTIQPTEISFMVVY
jgi:hypothetical protein